MSTFVFLVKPTQGNACISTEPIVRNVRCWFKKPEICTACLGQPGMEGDSKENGFLGWGGGVGSWTG